MLATETPEDHAVSPSACRWCCRDERSHSLEWAELVGYHPWEEPTIDQRRERMLARRQLR